MTSIIGIAVASPATALATLAAINDLPETEDFFQDVNDLLEVCVYEVGQKLNVTDESVQDLLTSGRDDLMNRASALASVTEEFDDFNTLHGRPRLVFPQPENASNPIPQLFLASVDLSQYDTSVSARYIADTKAWALANNFSLASLSPTIRQRRSLPQGLVYIDEPDFQELEKRLAQIKKDVVSDTTPTTDSPATTALPPPDTTLNTLGFPQALYDPETTTAPSTSEQYSLLSEMMRQNQALRDRLAYLEPQFQSAQADISGLKSAKSFQTTALFLCRNNSASATRRHKSDLERLSGQHQARHSETVLSLASLSQKLSGATRDLASCMSSQGQTPVWPMVTIATLATSTIATLLYAISAHCSLCMARRRHRSRGQRISMSSTRAATEASDADNLVDNEGPTAREAPLAGERLVATDNGMENPSATSTSNL